MLLLLFKLFYDFKRKFLYLLYTVKLNNQTNSYYLQVWRPW